MRFMFERYKRFIEQYIDLNLIEWKLFESKLALKSFKKGETLLHQGDVCKELYFINSGLARGYIIDANGKDFTWSIYFNDTHANMTNLFVTDYESFLHQKPSSIHIEALEDCEIVVASFLDVEFIYNNLKKGERFGRLMAQEAYCYLHNRIIARETKSAKERFEIFLDQMPHLLEKVPQYHIATFLGITPQHLSRLKNANAYLINQPKATQQALEELRTCILEVVPHATQLINYGVLAFALRKGGKAHEQIMIAGYKNHIGFYPHPDTIEAFGEDLRGYKFAKGSVQFPLNKPMPKELVAKMVRYRYEQIQKRD